jgi:hypothetical protein
MPDEAEKLQRIWNKSFIYIKKYVSSVTIQAGIICALESGLGSTYPGNITAPVSLTKCVFAGR